MKNQVLASLLAVGMAVPTGALAQASALPALKEAARRAPNDAAAAVALASLQAFERPSRAARFGAAVAVGALLRPELYLALPVYGVAAVTRRPRPSSPALRRTSPSSSACCLRGGSRPARCIRRTRSIPR